MISLAGRRIVLTRAAEDNAAWAERLRAIGAIPVLLPCIECATLTEAERPLRAALEECDWLALSSRRGVRAVHELAGGALSDTTRIAVVGPATAAEAERLLGRVDRVASDGSAASLGADLLAVTPAPRRVLAAGARDGRDDLARALTSGGVDVRTIAVYATRALTDAAPEPVRDALAADAVFLASPSALHGLANVVGRGAALPPLVTIGHTTSAAVRGAGLSVAAESGLRSIDGLVAALHRLLTDDNPSEDT